MMDAQLKARLASKRFSEEPGPDLPRHYAEQGSFEDDESTLDGSSWKMDEVVVQEEEEEEEEEEEAPKQDEDDDEEERASTSRRSSLWLQEASRESMVGLGHYAVDSVANPMVRLAEAKEVIELEGKTKIRFGVHWQFFPGMPKVDLDLTAVCFDGFGTTLDAAHCNHRSAYGGALKHSGDEGILTNKHSGDASLELIEFIDFDMPSIPEHVQAVALVVNARSGGTFKDVESAYANLRCLDEKVPEALAEFEVSGFGGAKDTGLLIGVMYMTPDTDLAPSEWVMLAKNATVEGETFVASLPQVQAIVDEVLDIDGALREERILKANETFDMEKYDTFVLPSDLFQGRGKRDLKIGLNWEGSVDLDASIVAVYKPSTNSIDGLVDGEVIFSGRLEGCEGSIRHLGDETGIGQAALLEFKHEGATYWRNVKYNELYDPETKDLVGIWDPDLQIINLAPIPKHLGEGEFVGGTDREVLLVDLDAIPTYVKTLNVVITRAVSLMSGEGIAKSTQGR
jgi:stress response protein SCP2